MFRSIAGNTAIPDALVYRVEGASEVTDLWEGRIVRLCNGRSVKNLMTSLYTQELKQGGSGSDIGMWKRLFDEQIINTIDKLEREQIIRLERNQVPAGKEDN